MRRRLRDACVGVLLVGTAIVVYVLQPDTGVLAWITMAIRALAFCYGVMFLFGSVLPGEWEWDSTGPDGD
jgi:ABC-type uncharacterized transport system permease subunit